MVCVSYNAAMNRLEIDGWVVDRDLGKVRRVTFLRKKDEKVAVIELNSGSVMTFYQRPPVQTEQAKISL